MELLPAKSIALSWDEYPHWQTNQTGKNPLCGTKPVTRTRNGILNKWIIDCIAKISHYLMTLWTVLNPFVTITNIIWIFIVSNLWLSCSVCKWRYFTLYKHVAGWNESACLLKQQASLRHQLWVDCGYPSVGVIAALQGWSKVKTKTELCMMWEDE